MLAAGSATFHRLLTLDLSDMGARSSSESSMVSSTFGDNSAADFNEDTEYLIRTDPTAKPPSRFVILFFLYVRQCLYTKLKAHYLFYYYYNY